MLIACQIQKKITHTRSKQTKTICMKQFYIFPFHTQSTAIIIYLQASWHFKLMEEMKESTRHQQAKARRPKQLTANARHLSTKT